MVAGFFPFRSDSILPDQQKPDNGKTSRKRVPTAQESAFRFTVLAGRIAASEIPAYWLLAGILRKNRSFRSRSATSACLFPRTKKASGSHRLAFSYSRFRFAVPLSGGFGDRLEDPRGNLVRAAL